MKFGITVLGSGSAGNSILVHDESSALLIDAGFSMKELFSRMEKAGFCPSIIKALLVSHEHGDHVKGARVLADSLGIPTYGTCQSLKYLSEKKLVGSRVSVFETGSVFQIGNFQVRPFSVPHDALDPVGFVILKDGKKVGIATDLGHLSALCVQRLFGCDALVLECNHDVEMQLGSERHHRLKRRILGKHGHLSNDDAINSMDSLLSEKTRYLCFSHLSCDCNSYELVENLALKKLAELNRTDILLAVARQEDPSPTCWLVS